MPRAQPPTEGDTGLPLFAVTHWPSTGSCVFDCRGEVDGKVVTGCLGFAGAGHQREGYDSTATWKR